MDQIKISTEDLKFCNEFLEHAKFNYYLDRHFLDKSIVIWRSTTIQNHILEITTHHHLSTHTSCTPDESFSSTVNTIKLPKKLHSDHPAHHFLPSFSRIMSDGYRPSLDDILCLHIHTTGKWSPQHAIGQKYNIQFIYFL